jgi:peptidoglycan/LPS O-acetylase OafA/YrhL
MMRVGQRRHAPLPGPGAAVHRFQYIDCVRGYAVMMVIACHVTFAYPELPYRIRQLTESGWYGVELFFLASALTLLMSWRAEAAAGPVSVRAFFIRRFFRIAPAYYCAGLLYTFVTPPQAISLGPIIRTVAFINTLRPGWLTAPGVWWVVPGGWSISVEVMFYLVFPLYAAVATSARRALLLLGLLIAAGLVANEAVLAWYAAEAQTRVIRDFLFFWFPNQAALFALGGLTYFLVARVQQPGLPNRLLVRFRPAALLCCTAAYGAVVYLPRGHFLGDSPVLPGAHMIGLPLAGMIVCLSVGRSLLVNRIVAAVGTVSFSVYLLHFAVLQALHSFAGTLGFGATGWHAVGAFVVGFVLVTVITVLAATVSYHVIEAPMIRFGRQVIAGLQAREQAKRVQPGMV